MIMTDYRQLQGNNKYVHSSLGTKLVFMYDIYVCVCVYMFAHIHIKLYL